MKFFSRNEVADSKTYIFGAGKRGQMVYQVLSAYGSEILGFIDNSAEKQGTDMCGKKVYGLPEVLPHIKAGGITVVISPNNYIDIRLQLAKQNIPYVLPDEIPDYYFTPFRKEPTDWSAVRPFNWYESPYPDLREIHEKEASVFDKGKEVLDIDFNLGRQLELLEEMKRITPVLWPEMKSDKYRYYYGNTTFCRGSADVLHYMMRIVKPKRIIEVGSGFSTAVMLDTNNECFGDSICIDSIEPYTERLRSLLRDKDNLQIHECRLQDIPLDFFNKLESGDILFIDSSHVSKIESDVNYYLFEIFPRLSNGVYIHFHDMFWPFIYPKKWVYKGLAYNEMFLLRAFLMNNSKYSVQFFGEMIMNLYPEKLNEKLKDISGSLWIRKD